MGTDSSTRRFVSTYSLLTVLLPSFVTQMLAPSKATPIGLAPTLKVPCRSPSLARNLVAVLSL